MNARALSADVLLGIAPIALVIALWQALVSFGYAPVSLLPPPGLVFVRLAQQLVTSGFLHEIGATLFRLFAGFSIAVVLGVGIGLAAAVNPAINAVVRPVVRVLAPVPKVALYPALLLLLGFDHASKITLVAADALFPILLSTYYGASMVEQKLIWSAMAAGTPRHQILFKVVLPAAMRAAASQRPSLGASSCARNARSGVRRSARLAGGAMMNSVRCRHADIS